MAVLHEAFVSSVATVALGQLLRRLFLRTPEQQQSIGLVSKIFLYLTIPSILFRTMYNGVHKMPIDGLLLAACCVTYEVSMALVASLVFRRAPRHLRGVAVGSSVSFAIGMFFLGLMEQIAGQTGTVLLALFDVPNAFFVYIAQPLIFRLLSRPREHAEESAVQLTAAASAEGDDTADHPPPSKDKKRSKPLSVLLVVAKFFAKNVSLVAVSLGLIFGLTGVVLPSWIIGIINIPANGNTLISYLLIGLYLDANPQSLKALWKYAVVSLALRYLIGIATGVALYMTVGRLFFSPMGRFVLLIGFVMPLPASVTALAAEQNGVDPSLCSLVTNCTFVLSFCIIWAMTSIAGIPTLEPSSSFSSSS